MTNFNFTNSEKAAFTNYIFSLNENDLRTLAQRERDWQVAIRPGKLSQQKLEEVALAGDFQVITINFPVEDRTEYGDPTAFSITISYQVAGSPLRQDVKAQFNRDCEYIWHE